MAVSTDTGGAMYAIAPQHVVVRCEEEPALLQCEVCNATLGADKHARDLLDGVPCPTPGCPGTLGVEGLRRTTTRSCTLRPPRARLLRGSTQG